MFDFLCAKLKQIRVKTKHFERKITQSLTFCYLIDINQENMTGLCKKYVCDNKKKPQITKEMRDFILTCQFLLLVVNSCLFDG